MNQSYNVNDSNGFIYIFYGDFFFPWPLSKIGLMSFNVGRMSVFDELFPGAPKTATMDDSVTKSRTDR